MPTLPLVGPAGEPVNLQRVFRSHGVASLPPFFLDEKLGSLDVTLPVEGAPPRTVRISQGDDNVVRVQVLGGRATANTSRALLERVRRVLNLDEDLSQFYRSVADDPDLAWVARGAGRMIRSATVFEEVVKTICTTNCAWGATVRMVTALVRHLGEPAVGAPSESAYGRAFPTPQAMAGAGEGFYRDVARAGYRGRFLVELAQRVARGDLDLELLATAGRDELPDAELEKALLALPGVGPYAAAHIMLLLGRYSPLILDSWTRPKYARLAGRKKVTDAGIRRRFRRYGEFAGLAFWLFVTSDWVPRSPPGDGV